MELIVIDIRADGHKPFVIKRNDDMLDEWYDHLTQYPDDYVVWRRTYIPGGNR